MQIQWNFNAINLIKLIHKSNCSFAIADSGSRSSAQWGDWLCNWRQKIIILTSHLFYRHEKLNCSQFCQMEILSQQILIIWDKIQWKKIKRKLGNNLRSRKVFPARRWKGQREKRKLLSEKSVRTTFHKQRTETLFSDDDRVKENPGKVQKYLLLLLIRLKFYSIFYLCHFTNLCS